MKITSSTIGMESARSFHASNVTVRRFMIKEYQSGVNASVTDSQGETEETDEQTAENTTKQAKEQKSTTLEEWQNRYQGSVSKIKIRSSVSDTVTDIRQATIRYIFDLLFASTNIFVANFKVMNYTQETFYQETESTSFSTVGTVKTADGREINFNVNVGMSREFQVSYREELDLASFKMCDPLVINLDTDVAQLSDQNFYFDIDADGEQDSIAALDGRSGYLALDKNNDNKINDGSELFGTASGDGFADLAEYDEDGNGWIDESDNIWSKLKIWCKDENGKDVLYRLADKGVGAICLQRAATDFTLQGDGGATKGAIRSTGIFLYENGNVGTMQHVDVAKYDKEA